MTYQEAEPSMTKILMVDDDKKLCRLVADYLKPTLLIVLVIRISCGARGIPQ
jgi:hypothetical protein